ENGSRIRIVTSTRDPVNSVMRTAKRSLAAISSDDVTGRAPQKGGIAYLPGAHGCMLPSEEPAAAASTGGKKTSVPRTTTVATAAMEENLGSVQLMNTSSGTRHTPMRNGM